MSKTGKILYISANVIRKTAGSITYLLSTFIPAATPPIITTFLAILIAPSNKKIPYILIIYVNKAVFNEHSLVLQKSLLFKYLGNLLNINYTILQDYSYSFTALDLSADNFSSQQIFNSMYDQAF